MRVGVIGGGQLAWMMAEAAKALEIKLVVQTPEATDPAVRIADDVVLAAIDDARATAELATRCDVITFENEFVNLQALSQLAQQGVCFYPQLETLTPLLDKYHQRCYLQEIELPVPKFAAVEADSIATIGSQFGFPVVLKTRRHGYDGQGTYIVKNQTELEAILPRLQQPLLLEEFVPFERELAIMVARDRSGKIITHPVVETQQVNQVCRRVFTIHDLDLSIVETVEAIAQTLISRLQAVGVFGIELFLTHTGQVLVNEIAPRTHNSGHLTLDACVTSQFEQQLRAVCGLPLGNPNLRWDGAVMVNLLGYESSRDEYLEQRQQLAQIPQAHLYWYAKPEARLGRKLGHITVPLMAGMGRSQAEAVAAQIESLWYPPSHL
jgi:5-(carboxyamino)imidazole ribonucleotide synthase